MDSVEVPVPINAISVTDSEKSESIKNDQTIPEESNQNESIEKYKTIVRNLKERGRNLRSDHNQPNISEKPEWFDEDLFETAKSVYSRHFMGINFAHLSGLLLLVRVDSIYRTLSKTGESDSVSKLFKRYYHTVKHVKTWYEGDIFEGQSAAQRSLMIVRGMHNKVSTKFNDSQKLETSDKVPKLDLNEFDETIELIDASEIDDRSRDNKNLVHISQYDIMITQFAFIGFIVTRAKNVGLIDDFSEKDLTAMLHFWRVIGYYLGATEDLNLCSHTVPDVVGLCEAIMELEYRGSIEKNKLESPPGIMSVNIVRSVKFIPMLTFYGIMRYLYELLGIETSEIDDRRTWFSNLSYTLIKLVMSTLLAYRPFRAFNNGLTRLSVYFVGHIEDWFASRLESKYGNELKI